MGQERLNTLSLMGIENEALHATDFSTELILNLKRASPLNSRCQTNMFEYLLIFRWSDFTITYLQYVYIWPT
jgi:hypothetical protein